MKERGFAEKSVFYYNKGYNCSQCILKAAEDCFNLNISQECYDLCKGIHTGLGIGVLVALFMLQQWFLTYF